MKAPGSNSSPVRLRTDPIWRIIAGARVREGFVDEVGVLHGPGVPRWVRALVDAWNRGDLEAVLSYLSEGIVVETPGAADMPGPLDLPSGKAAFRAAFATFWARQPSFELMSVLADDASASLVLRDRDGRNLTLLLTLDGPGTVSRITAYRPA